MIRVYFNPFAQVWLCDLCGLEGIGKMSSIDHLMQQHLPINQHRCECGADYDSSYLKMQHMRVAHLIQSYICMRCSKTLRDLVEFQTHQC